MFNSIKDVECFENYSLKKLSTFKIGGNARFYLECFSTMALKKCIKKCLKNNIKFKIIGNGSNLLFDDLGYNGAIIKIKNESVKLCSNQMLATASMHISKLLNLAINHNLSGLENFIGIPASLGGAIKNNLGAFGAEISNLVSQVTVLRFQNQNHKIIKLNISHKDFSYRKANFLELSDIIISAKLNLKKLDKTTILNNMTNCFKKKNDTQPLNRFSAGSIFKRNNDIIPAKIIDELGLKGVCINDAEISTKHAGFIVNNGDASSNDVLKLIEFIKHKVKEKYDINLEEEIEYVPF
ncbi:MAG: UDP-N-acetylmuramate dehydrogenase [Clostridia bacterium]|nr:UDP-N-acetylmuramate dehydrogenase [Clostridia bacterium]